MIRRDLPDVIYKTEEAKFRAIAKEEKARHAKGQPILIGTVSIAKNELLAEYLRKEGVPFELLNAKNHEREANIIAQAGSYGAVTLATNIAGRGVDILLGGNPVDPDEAARVREAGGLIVIGTERHESRRIDNQLRGRSGRQGDPGESQFFVSLEDDLMRLFGGERLKSLMTTLGLADDEPIENAMISKSIEQAQKKIEGINFDTRKHVLEFDDVLNRQREMIYARRRVYLGLSTTDEAGNTVDDEVKKMLEEELAEIVNFSFDTIEDTKEAVKKIQESIGNIMPITAEFNKKIEDHISFASDPRFAILDDLLVYGREQYEVKANEIGKEAFSQIQRFLCLQSLDMLWMEHLDTMDHLRDSVRLRGYGQRDPLVEYKREGFNLFKLMLKDIQKQVVYTVFKVQLQPQILNEPANIEVSGGNQLPPDIDPTKIQRNDPCPCGSGKKWKKCHGKNA